MAGWTEQAVVNTPGMSSRQKKPDARALFKQAKSRKGENGLGGSSVGPAPAALPRRGLPPGASGGVGRKYGGKSKEEVKERGEFCLLFDLIRDGINTRSVMMIAGENRASSCQALDSPC